MKLQRPIGYIALVALLCLCVAVFAACDDKEGSNDKPAETAAVYTAVSDYSAWQGLYLGLDEAAVYETVITADGATVKGEETEFCTSDKDDGLYVKTEDGAYDKINAAADSFVIDGITYHKAVFDDSVSGYYVMSVNLSGLNPYIPDKFIAITLHIDGEKTLFNESVKGDLYRAGNTYLYKYNYDVTTASSGLKVNGYLLFTFSNDGNSLHTKIIVQNVKVGNGAYLESELDFAKIALLTENADCGLQHGIYTTSYSNVPQKVKVTADGIEFYNADTDSYDKQIVGRATAPKFEVRSLNYVPSSEEAIESLYVSSVNSSVSHVLVVDGNTFTLDGAQYTLLAE